MRNYPKIFVFPNKVNAIRILSELDYKNIKGPIVSGATLRAAALLIAFLEIVLKQSSIFNSQHITMWRFRVVVNT